MKKLLALGCVVLAFQNVSHVAHGYEAQQAQDGRRTLVKALAVMVNAQANRKLPPKRLHVPPLESPRV